MSGMTGDDRDDCVDLVGWTIRDAIRRDVGHTELPDPYATLAGLGYGNPVDVRKILANADQELEHPESYPRTGGLVQDSYRIVFAKVNDAFIAGCIGQRADQIAGNLVDGGFVVRLTVA
jgi:hypothetical protein